MYLIFIINMEMMDNAHFNKDCIGTKEIIEKCILTSQNKAKDIEDKNSRRRIIVESYNYCIRKHYEDCLKNCKVPPTNFF